LFTILSLIIFAVRKKNQQFFLISKIKIRKEIIQNFINKILERNKTALTFATPIKKGNKKQVL